MSRDIIETCTDTSIQEPQSNNLVAVVALLIEISIYGVNVAIVLIMCFKVKTVHATTTASSKAEAERQVGMGKKQNPDIPFCSKVSRLRLYARSSCISSAQHRLYLSMLLRHNMLLVI
jgi:hypothetical protein